MKVYVVIAVHNRKQYTLNCLRLLEQQTYANFNIIVVDDGSTDGTSVEVADNYSSVQLINGNGSWWWTRSMNEGFKLALKNGADIVITLNNDLTFNQHLVHNLIELHVTYPKHLIGCLNLIQKENSYVFFSGIIRNIWWKAQELKYHKAFTPTDGLDLKGVHPTTCLNGRGTLIPRSVFEAIGYFDDVSFPQYASDYDFTLRASQAGFSAFISWDNHIISYAEETGEGKSFIRQKWFDFLSSYFNRYASTSVRMWLKYYLRHGGVGAITGICFQILRQLYAFKRKRNLLNTLK